MARPRVTRAQKEAKYNANNNIIVVVNLINKSPNKPGNKRTRARLTILCTTYERGPSRCDARREERENVPTAANERSYQKLYFRLITPRYYYAYNLKKIHLFARVTVRTLLVRRNHDDGTM